jgi:hypothetical protein
MVVRRLKPKPVFSDPKSREELLKKANANRVSRPDAVFKYPFRDENGTVEEIFNCDIATAIPDFCVINIA